MSNEYFNHCMLTGQILEQEHKTSRKGNTYLTGRCQMKGLDVKLPFRAFGEAAQQIQAGETYVMIGSFRFQSEQLMLMINEVQVPINKQPENHCQLTLRAGKDGELKYSQKGNAWAYTSAALSMGKDKNGDYRPSWWVDVKGFAKGDDESIPLSISSLGKGDLFTVSGRLTHRLYKDRSFWSIIADESICIPEEIRSDTHAELVPD